MRTMLTALVTALAFGLLQVPAANAAWKCLGPAPSCASDTAKVSKSAKAHYKSKSKSAYAKSLKHKKLAHKTAKHKKVAYKGTKHKKVAYKGTKYKKVAYKPQKSKKYAKKATSTATYAASSGSFGGIASYYWQPQRVASGGWFNPNALTAAHKTLPFGTLVRVTNRNNGRSVTVRINDRGPYVKGRVIDLSRAAAQQIGMTGSGVAPVSVAVLGRG